MGLDKSVLPVAAQPLHIITMQDVVAFMGILSVFLRIWTDTGLLLTQQKHFTRL